MSRLLPLAAVLAGCSVLLGFTAFRDPQRQDAIRWSSPTVEVILQQSGSDDISDGSDLTSLRGALETWAGALPAGLTLVEGAASSSRDYGNDGVNRITFLEGSWPGGGDSALGATIPHVVIGDPSTFVDVDIILNGTDGPWTTDGTPTGIDVRSVVTHELGHLLGLWHTFDASTVMYFGARAGTTFRRALHADDAQGATYVASAALSCGSAGECPLLVAHPDFGGSDLRLTCQDSRCVPGAAGYGAECLSGDHCQSGHCLRDPWTGNGRDPGACTETCAVGAGDCPGGDLCRSFGEDSYCVPGRECLEDTDCTGGVNVRCLFDFDGHYRCRGLCERDDHCSASRCVDLGYGAGICVTPGPAPNGAPCLDPLSCEGLACRGGAEELTCQTAMPRQDGGVVPDVPVVTDGGWNPDGAGRDGGGGGYEGGSIVDAVDDRQVTLPDNRGCSCAASLSGASGAPALALLLLGFLGLRSRRWSRR